MKERPGAEVASSQQPVRNRILPTTPCEGCRIKCHQGNTRNAQHGALHKGASGCYSFLGGPWSPGTRGSRRAERSRPRAQSPAPPTWGRGPSNDSVQRVGGGGAGSSGRRSFLPGTAQPPPPREPPVQASALARDPGARPRAPCPALRRPPVGTMRASPPPAPLLPLLLLALLAAPAAAARTAESAPAPQPERPPRPPPGPGPANATRTGLGVATGGGGGGSPSSNSSGDALVTRISSVLRDLSTLKAAVIVACAFTTVLIACLLLRVFRSGKRLKKTRKYDIITTPAERVEMAPLNEEDDDDEDSTVFDIKYR
ncbi:membrane protein FAM174B [Dasypus novemcinctus]|uniref:membrane protein FAM174B n=1 Tax=Dasypus novemcinctus TaxID=9361 RepID=UPI0039C9CEFE